MPGGKVYSDIVIMNPAISPTGNSFSISELKIRIKPENGSFRIEAEKATRFSSGFLFRLINTFLEGLKEVDT